MAETNQQKVSRIAVQEGVDPDLALRVASTESGFNSNAVSPKGARGLMQVMPATYQEVMGPDSDPNNVDNNVTAGLRYLAKQLKTFKGDERLSLAAYNAGAGAVKKYGGIPPYKETQDYVAKITGGKARATPAKQGYEVIGYSDIDGNDIPLENPVKKSAPVAAKKAAPYEVIGYEEIEAPAPAVAPVAESANATYGDRAKDLGISTVQGVVDVGQAAVGLGDIVSGGRIGKLAEQAGVKFEETDQILEGLKSTAGQADKAALDNAQGFTDTAKTIVQNPNIIPNAITRTIPSILGGSGIANALVKLMPKIGAIAAGAIGEGVIGAGSQAEGIRSQTDDGLITPTQSALSAATGLSTAVISRFSGNFAQKLGIKDIDNVLVNGSAEQVDEIVKKSLGRKLVEGGFTESVLEEMPQSGIEQMLSNVALDKPIMEGVAKSAAIGGLTAAPMGAGAQLIPQAPAIPQTRGQRIIAELKARQSGQPASTVIADEVIPASPANPSESINAADLLEDDNVSNTEQGAASILDSGIAGNGRDNPSGSAVNAVNDVNGIRSPDIGQTVSSNLPTGNANSANSPLDNPTPEPKATLDAQTTAFIEGTKPALLITEGEALPQNLPNDIKTAVIPNRGTLIYRDDISLQQALNGNMGEALGYGINEKPAQPTSVVTARDANGTVIQDVATDGRQSVIDAATKVAGNGTVEVRPIEAALAEREAGVKAAETPVGNIETPVGIENMPNVPNITNNPIVSNTYLGSSGRLKTPKIAQSDLTQPATPVKPKKPAKKAGTLLATLRDIGGIALTDKRDVTGEDKRFIGGGYNQIFKGSAKQTLRGAIESGLLDEFLPYSMRLSAQTADSEAYDSTEAYDYLADKIRNGTRTLSYEAEQELEQKRYDEKTDTQAAVDLIAEEFNEDEINAELQIAGYNEREAQSLATDFDASNEDSSVESGTGSQASEKTESLTKDQADGFVKVAADSIKTLRKQDVERVLDETPSKYRKELAAYITKNRSDLAEEVADIEAEAPALELQGQTNAEIEADIKATRDREVKAAADEAKAKSAKDAEDLKTQQKKNANERPFEFGENIKDVKQAVKAGSEDMFTLDEKKKDEPAAPVDAKVKQAQDDLDGALSDLGSIFGKSLRNNITPEQEQKLIPVLTRVFDAAFRLGYYEFKAAAKFVLDTIRSKISEEVADIVTIDQLQGAYISMAGKYGDQATKKRDVVNIESIEELQESDNVNDKRSSANLESDSGQPEPTNGMGAQNVQDGRNENSGSGKQRVSNAENESDAQGSNSLFDSQTIVTGERGNSEIYTGKSPTQSGLARDSDNRGSGDGSFTGTPIEPPATEGLNGTTQSGLFALSAKPLQAEADRVEQNTTLDNIRETLPLLQAGQQEDVFKAETRFAEPKGFGMLFTNGTGTGKTFTGLGVVKRFVNSGKKNVLIIAPNDKIIEDWQNTAKLFNITANRLETTNDAGRGVVITTYSNMGNNLTLADRNWDLIVHDEAHYLAMDKDGTNTNALKTLRAITQHPQGVFTRTEMLHRDLRAKITALYEEKKTLTIAAASDERNYPKLEKVEAEIEAANLKWSAVSEAVKEKVKANQGEGRPRALFLSATPFAYEKTVDWANGYLFDYDAGKEQDGASGTGNRSYNTGSNRDQFMMQNFGYRMRYNKLTEPDAKVNRGLMQRQFNTSLKKAGTLSGRMLDVEADYDRKFVLIDSAIGRRIDEALGWFREKRDSLKTSGLVNPRANAYSDVEKIISDQFDYLSRRYLLEAIKAKEVVVHVKEHMALGRKVVVFHDYKKGGGFNPFNISARSMGQDWTTSGDTQAINEIIEEFKSEFKDLINAPDFKSSSPIDTFKQAFPGVLLFNGDVPTKVRRANVAKFQDDASGPQVILVQSAAGKEGISLHDTTGKHARVLFNLGQPTQPTTSIQQEGRIYRTGQVTDAMFRYLNTGTNWERWAFATTIAQRASAAENLALGEQARALKDAFISGFEESDSYRAGMENEGKGGKERDKAANEALTEYDRAKAFYYGTQKKNSKTKAQEGADYFATPEPVGLKMVELADIRPGEKVLEPSAGHGAIARWFPEGADKTAIEPSSFLRPRLAMVFDGAINSGDFEDLNTINKYDAIVMNPPFGTAGKTAIDHMAKASKHLNDGGRIVALIPVGSTDKKFDKWFYETETRPLKPIFEKDGMQVFAGDTVKMAGFGKDYEIKDVVIDDIRGTQFFRTKGQSKDNGINAVALKSVDKIGKRTEEFSPTKGFTLVADIKLPSVTFERAGTAVNTRIVVIEKSESAPQISNRDYTDVTDINELFDRMETLEIPARAKAKEADNETDAAPARTTGSEATRQNDQAARERDAKALESGAIAQGGEAVTFKIEGDKLITNAPAQTITTSKGKELEGVFITDSSIGLSAIKEVDRFTYYAKGKGAGYFVRLRHVVRPTSDDVSFSNAGAPTFYSALTRAIDAIQTKKADPVMWKGLIKNLAQKGVKPDEIEWTGVTDWLDLQTGAVTKEQVLDYLNSNGVEVSETMLGKDTGTTDQDVIDFQGIESTEWADASNSQRDEWREEFYSQSSMYAPATKYSQYTVPGGTNYKELLLTLPEKAPPKSIVEWTERIAGEWNADADGRQFGILEEDNNSFYVYEKDGALGKKVKSLDDAKLQVESALVKNKTTKYKSSHFDQANILAHVRFDERLDADGNKVLFIHELQSDWSSDGRKKGFVRTLSNVEKARSKELSKKMDDYITENGSLKAQRNRYGLSETELSEWSLLDIQDKGEGVPRAPFVEKTDAYLALALKRMMRYAAENGFNKVAIINGQQAADLYDLSKQVDKIRAFKRPEGTYFITADGRTLSDEMKESELEGAVGKDLATKIINGDNKKSDGFQEFKGVDLKVGGEGMRFFYDTLVPKVAKDVLKKVGGSVETISLSSGKEIYAIINKVTGNEIGGGYTLKQAQDKVNNDPDNKYEYYKVSGGENAQTGFTITPDMRNKVMQGLPLFSQGTGTGGLLIDDIKAAIANDIYGQEVDIYPTMMDAPIYVQTQALSERKFGIEGFYDKRTNRVALIASNLSSIKRAKEVARHELIGHYGMENMLNDADPKLLSKLLNRVLFAEKSGNKQIIEIAQYVDETQPNLSEQRRAKEIIAVMAERNIQNSITKRVIDAVRLFLKKIGFIKSDVTDAKIAGLLRDAQVYLKGKGRSLVEPTMQASFSNNATKDIPDAIILNPLGTAKNDTDYEAAKAGDVVAATRLAKKLITNDVIKQLKEQIKNADLVVGVTSIEQSGKNALPEAAAILIADKLSLKYDENLLQLVSPKRTGMSGMDRIFNRPVFEGDVQPNASYILVDDTITQGGTFAAMTNRINEGGANVIANIALTGKDYSSKIAISDSMLEKVRSQFGDLENEFRAITKYGFEGLTHSEARFVTLGNAPDKFRDRIIAETKKAASNTNTSTAKAGQDVSFSNNPTPPTGGVFTSQQPLNPNFEIPQTSKLDNVLRSVQDKNIDLKRVTANIKKSIGDISDNINAYLQEELYHGRAAKRTQDFLNNELNPLITAMQTRGVTMADFEEYLWARHAEERNIQIAKVNPKMPDRGSGLTTKEANDYLNSLSAGQKRNFEALAARVDAITKGSRQVLVDYNLESAGTVLSMEGAYKNYVPLMREDMDMGFGQGTGQGVSVKGNSSKRATGSNRAVVDILANIAQQRERNIIRGEKNRVATALVGLAKTNPNKDFWQVDVPPTITDINKATGMVEVRIDPNYKNRNNVVVARIADKKGNIQERAVVFSERNERAVKMALNLKNLDQDQLGVVLSNAAVITRWFSSINTQYNPMFGVVNIMRDVQGALLNLSSTPLKGMQTKVLAETAKTIGPLYAEIRAIQKNGKSTNTDVARLYEDFQREGGKTGYQDMFRNAEERGKAISKTLDPNWWQTTKLGKVVSLNGLLATPEQWLMQKPVKLIFDWLSDYNEALENTVRLATYKVGLDKGLSKQQAASVAKNISVNFNRKGTVGAQVGSLYAFFNASVQGSARIAETLMVNDNGKLSLSKTGKKIISGGLLLGAMQAIAMAMAGFDDDEPPEFVRDRNIIIPLSGGKYVAIPMPLGFNAIPSIGRIMTEWVLSGGEDTGGRVVHILDVLLNVTNPIGNAGLSIQTVAPTLIDPLVALSENKDFTGRKIAKEDFNSKNPTPGYSRAKDTASRFSTGIAYFINSATGGNKYREGAISPTPDQIDYLFGQVTGGVGREGSKIIGALDSLAIGEDIPNYKKPLIGKFYGNAKNNDAERTTYYDNVVELNKLELEYKGRLESKDELDEFKTDNPKVKAIMLGNNTDKIVTKLVKQRKQLQASGASSDRIKQINELIALKMKRLNEAVRKIEAE